MSKYMDLAIKEAKKAYKNNEIPVGCIIVKNNKIISKAYNQKEKKRNVIKHAEIIAIEKACNKMKNWRLDDCEIYVTMEPCMMCCGAIIQSRINKVVYGIENKKNNIIQKIPNVEIVYEKNEKIKELVQKFFEKIRE